MVSPKDRQEDRFETLIAILNEEAERLSHERGGMAKLMAKGVDLRPRLAPEKNTRAKRPLSPSPHSQ